MESYLKSASQIVRDVILEKSLASVVLAAPAPDILAITIRLALVQDCQTNSPHDDAEDEEAHSEGGVIDCDLLGPSVTTSVVTPEDNERHKERYACDNEESYLWPCLAVWCPSWETISWR